MRALLLAAGRGSRMNELTRDLPKCFIPFLGKRLIDWQLETLKSAGITEIGILTGYRAEAFEEFPVHCFLNREWNSSNMVRTLCEASDWLHSDTCVVSYTDILYPSSTIHTVTQSKGDIVIPYNTEWRKLWEFRFENPLLDAESFRLSKTDGRLLEIGKRANSLDEIEGQYMGLVRLTPRGWSDFQSVITDENRNHLDMTSALQLLIQNKIRIDTTPIHNHWYEFDSKKDLELYSKQGRSIFTTLE